MQTIISVVQWLVAHKTSLISLLLLVILYAAIELLAWLWYGPRDTTGNGITIGRAKAFDNRSLALRIERLSNRLASLNVVNLNVAENVSTIQQQTSNQSTQSITVEAKVNPAKANEGAAPQKTVEKPNSEVAAATAPTSDSKPTVALAAGDVLNDQLNLASQILNLETLYERSLTDRLLGDKPRLQTVLGFQVSITPPRGCKNSTAIVEIGVRYRPKEKPAGSSHSEDDQKEEQVDDRVSVVALIPQEKTYNAQTVSTSSRSIGGSAVASVLTLGFTRKGETRQLFIHRDSDTIAFERDPRAQPTLFENYSNATVFGWEFRPVLGRSTVSPGMRQMLAVIAMPTAEGESTDDASLEIKTRSYWRHFNPKNQTSSGKWGWWPLSIDRSMVNDFPSHIVKVPNTALIQDALAPKVSTIQWVSSGPDGANVIVKGSNFFSGTRVLLGGKVLSEADGRLTLKSNQALEFEAGLTSLVTGDCVLSGRFGASIPLTVSRIESICALGIVQAVIEPSPHNNAAYLTIDVKAFDKDGDDTDLTVAHIQKLPEPILFVGTEAVPMPYDYFDKDPEEDEAKAASQRMEAEKGAPAAHAQIGLTQSTPVTLDPKSSEVPTSVEPPREKGTASAVLQPSTKKYVRVGVWIPKTLAVSQTVSFRIPFCGLEYQTSLPLTYSEPTVTLMGSDDDDCVFRITSAVGFKQPFSVELDRIYSKDDSENLQKTSAFDYRFKVPAKLAAQYPNVIVRTGDGEHLFPISVDTKPTPKTTLLTSGKPSEIKQGTIGPVEWSGTALDAIQKVEIAVKASSSTPTAARNQADFAAYDDGKRIRVYFDAASTKDLGKVEVQFTAKNDEIVSAPLFVVDKNPES